MPVVETGQPKSQLTQRQVQVVQLAVQGLSDKEIARDLGLSYRTVRDHFTEARRRWGAATRIELIAKAVASGTVSVVQPDGARHSAGKDEHSENLEFPNRTIIVRPSRRAPLGAHPVGSVRAMRTSPGRPTVMTPERIAEARKLLRDHQITQIARQLGVSRTTIYSHMGAITGTALRRFQADFSRSVKYFMWSE